MFEPTKDRPPDMFNSFFSKLPEKKKRILEDPNAWHNLFYRNVTSKIDENIFKILYCHNNGRPNASVRILIAMNILKEGFGWTDEQLFNECDFNIQVMFALGISNLTDSVPSESSYYGLRKTIYDYSIKTGKDLFKVAFSKITNFQIETYGVSGRQVRLDSKLISSNIAKSSRLQLILETLKASIKNADLTLASIQDKIRPEQFDLLKSLDEKTSSNIVFGLNSSEKSKLLIDLGHTLSLIVDHYTKHGGGGGILERLFNDQYKIIDKQGIVLKHDQPTSKNEKENKDEDKLERPNEDDLPDSTQTRVKQDSNQLDAKSEILPKQAKEISSDSIQSPYDLEATYRSKGEGASKQVKSGFHANITEACTPNKKDLKIIADYDVKPANVSESEFLQDSLVESQKGLSSPTNENKIEQAIVDGGYDNLSNREEMDKAENPDLLLVKTKGAKQQFTLSLDEENNLTAHCKKTEKKLKTWFNKKTKKYVIKSGKRKYRYLTLQKVRDYILRAKYESLKITDELQGLRANVESTIHQVFHRLGKNDKIRYRGLFKCKLYVGARVLWTNFTRIMKKELEKAMIFINLMLWWIIKPHNKIEKMKYAMS